MTKADVRRLSLTTSYLPNRILPACLALAGIAFSSPVHAQDASPLERVEALDLDTARVGRVTAYFATDDRERAVELAALSEEAASFFDRELAISFDVGVAALAPEHWFSEFPGIPYAIPWPSVLERLLFVPSSLEEGLLVRGRSSMTERRRVVDFVTLHEYGHLATKEYFYPASERDDIPVSWFNELLPNIFAYAFVASTDPEWAKAGKEMWRGVVESREPPVLSLDWGFMNDLPPDELVRTYAWYQNLLNLRAVELYEEHGLDFLRMAKERLAWEEADSWTTESLLAALEEIAPGFQGWARDLRNGDYLSREGDVGDQAATLEVASVAASFDGADYSTEADKVGHGERVARLLGCNSCHAEDYTGINFGEMIPIVEGLWATNISLTMPNMSDAELERLLREGVHPTREMYLMPSKQSQFLGGRDMDALIAYLRTIEPAGEPTPLPPPDFEEAVTSRLPDDYWRTTEEGHPRSYHNAAEEATYFAENTVPELGEEHAQGRLVVQTVCTSCHGAAMDGVGEPAGDIQGALDYDNAEFERLLRDGVGRNGEAVEINWGQDHTPAVLTDSEIAAAISYTRALATGREELDRRSKVRDRP